MHYKGLLCVAWLWAHSWPPHDFFQAWLLFGTIPASIVCCLRHFCLHLSLHLLQWWRMEKKVNMFIFQNSPNDCLQSFESVKTVTIFKWFCQESAFMLLAPFVLLSGMTKFAIFLRRSNYSVMHNKWRQIVKLFLLFPSVYVYDIKAVVSSLKYMKAPSKIYLLEGKLSPKTEEIWTDDFHFAKKMIWILKLRAIFFSVFC